LKFPATEIHRIAENMMRLVSGCHRREPWRAERLL
jgi:hypothetical protein